jgi:hypothetical protein
MNGLGMRGARASRTCGSQIGSSETPIVLGIPSTPQQRSRIGAANWFGTTGWSHRWHHMQCPSSPVRALAAVGLDPRPSGGPPATPSVLLLGANILR